MTRFSGRLEDTWVNTLRLLVLASLVAWIVAAWSAWSAVGKPFPGFYYEQTMTVSPLNASSATAGHHGLALYDSLLTANGRPLRTPRDLEGLVDGVPPGTPIRYEYLRGHQHGTAVIPTGTFTLREFALTILPLLVAGLLHFLVGGISFWLKPRDRATQAHLLMTFSVGMICSLVGDFDLHRWLAPFWLASLFLLGSSFLHLALVFPEPRGPVARRPSLAYLVYLPAILASTILLTIDRPLGHVANPGGDAAYHVLIQLWAAWLLIGLLGLVGSIIHAARHASTSLARAQARVAVLGASVSYLPNALAFLLPIVIGSIAEMSGALVNLSRMFSILFPFSIAYAIARHRMFDIAPIIRRTVVYSAVVVALTAVYFLTLLGVGAGIERIPGASGSGAANLLATVLVALAYPPLRDRTKDVVDRLFFRASYDFQTVVTRFGEQARQIRQAERLQDQFLNQVEQALHPSFLAVLIRPEGSQELVPSAVIGIAPAPGFSIPADHPVLRQHMAALGTFLVDPYDFEGLGEALCLPLIIEDDLVGCVLVGPRKSDLPYAESDRLLLANLTQQLAVWLKNAQLFEQLARRAAELEDLVALYEQANREARTDPLTDLYNRRAFLDHLTHHQAQARRYGRPLSLIMFDIDHFKRFNDTYGHAIGDMVIGQVASTLKAAVRLCDIPARWGGEEFIVALPDTAPEDAMVVAERIRTMIAGSSPEDGQGQPLPPITVSVGLSAFETQDPGLDVLIERADHALYAAKAKGRNQVQSLLTPSSADRPLFH